MKSYASIEFLAPRQSPWMQDMGIGSRINEIFKLLETWQTRSQQRKDLEQMEHRLLRDIGIDPVEAAKEAAKPFWRP